MQIVNTKLPNENLQTYQVQMTNSGGGGTTKRKLWTPNCQMKISKPTNYRWSIPGGGEVNYQMQIVNTKLPNENVQTYQLQMIDSGGRGGGGKLPNANCEDQTTKWKSPNLPSTNDQFWGGGETTKRKLWTPNCQMKISKPTNYRWSIPGEGEGEVNYQMQIVNTKLPNENLQTYQLQMIDSGGEVNYQMQIVNTKLPNENVQTYQLQMIDSGGGGVNYQMQIVKTKLPNENVQTYQLQMIDSGGGGGGIKYQMQIVKTKLPNENLQTYQVQMTNSGGGGVNYQKQIVDTKLPIVIPSTTNTILHVKLKKWSHKLHLVVYPPPPPPNQFVVQIFWNKKWKTHFYGLL